jgi:hypothetical protein
VTVAPAVTVATLNYPVGHPALDRVAPTMTVAAVFRIQTIERFVVSFIWTAPFDVPRLGRVHSSVRTRRRFA